MLILKRFLCDFFILGASLFFVLLVAFFIAFKLTSPAVNLYEDGVCLLKTSQYEEAVPLVQKASRLGIKYTAMRLPQIYLYAISEGKPFDVELAMRALDDLGAVQKMRWITGYISVIEKKEGTSYQEDLVYWKNALVVLEAMRREEKRGKWAHDITKHLYSDDIASDASPYMHSALSLPSHTQNKAAIAI